MKRWCVGAALALIILGIVSAYEENDILIIDQFSSFDPKTHFPKHWRSKKNKGVGKYIVEEKDGNYVLHVKSRSENVAILKEFEFDLKEYPFLNWRWKVIELPKNGDERYKRSVDSGASIYIIFKNPSIFSSKTLRYCWSTTLPVGAIVTSPYYSGSKIIVVESGDKKVGRWVMEKRNVYLDFKKVFKDKEPEKVRAIAILSDSDNTRSLAEAYYDDIFVSKR
ncbi:MAG: DUF3047 domain-containing protein [bacterium]|nr:DUF3047 domain-containing protein [bacterium]